VVQHLRRIRSRLAWSPPLPNLHGLVKYIVSGCPPGSRFDVNAYGACNHSVTGGKRGQTEGRDSHAEPAGVAEKARRTICSGYPGEMPGPRNGSPERLSLAAFGQATGFRSQGTRTGFDSFTPYPLDSLPLAEERARDPSLFDWHHSSLPPVTEWVRTRKDRN
jgi:hypothetical protein